MRAAREYALAVLEGPRASLALLAKLPRVAFFSALILAIVATLVDLTRGPGSIAEVRRLHHDVVNMRAANAALERQNALLTAEIQQLRSGTDAIEEQAREQLGMIKKGESFYLIDPAGGCPISARQLAADGSAGFCGIGGFAAGSGGSDARGSHAE